MSGVSREGRRRGTRHAGIEGRRVRGNAGFTLIELAIAISVLMIGMVTVLSATSRMHSLRKQTRERTLAQNAVRSMTERIHARSYEFSSAPDTWAANMVAALGPDGEFGGGFDVRGIATLDDRPSDGTITVLTDERTTAQDAKFRIGMPRDLNGDGDADDSDVSGDARILPVLLEVRWRSQSGIGSYRHAFFVMGY